MTDMTEAATRILLVEDDDDDYVLTRDLLAQIAGGTYTLDWVTTFEAGLAAAAERRHDVYLIDYRLGVDSGLDLLRAVLIAGCRAPLILLTGQGDRSVDSEAMQAGAADYLVKGEITPAALERAFRHARDREYMMALREALAGMEALQAGEERFRAQYRGFPLPTFTWRRIGGDWIFTDCNTAADTLMGGLLPQNLGRPATEIFARMPDALEMLGRCAREGGIVRGERAWHVPAHSEPRDIIDTWVSVAPDLIMQHVEDVTEHRRAEESLRRQALYDSLTGLPNRALLHAHIDTAFGDAPDDPRPLAVLMLDLDHFKEINDAFGHHQGDALLREVAGRIRGAVRAADTVARLGGDEFAVLLPGADKEVATQVAKAIRATLDHSLAIEEQQLRVDASVGIALAPLHGADGSTLLRCADMAMYAAKRGRLGQALYEPAQDQHSPERMVRIAELREAIERGALALHYQPQVDLVTGHVCGVEALVRWPHPLHGLIPPDQFIPLTEQTGLIAPLTDWVLAEAIRQCREWQRTGLQLGVSVNLSMWNLHDPALPERIAGLLGRHALSPSWLRLELTESTLMADTARTMDVLARLSAIGLRLAVDDFGAGYSSLAYLKKLPIDELKIDKGFVHDMATDATDAAIVASTVAMGCDVAQGYHIARPLAPDALTRWLRETSWAVA